MRPAMALKAKLVEHASPNGMRTKPRSQTRAGKWCVWTRDPAPRSNEEQRSRGTVRDW
jgi:hypothetical protein